MNANFVFPRISKNQANVATRHGLLISKKKKRDKSLKLKTNTDYLYMNKPPLLYTLSFSNSPRNESKEKSPLKNSFQRLQEKTLNVFHQSDMRKKALKNINPMASLTKNKKNKCKHSEASKSSKRNRSLSK